MRRPLSVVGTDQEALRALLTLHACPEPRILDVTHNRGRMWKGLPYKPHRSDKDAALQRQGFTDTVADFRDLPFGTWSFDVVVFDPPHIDHARGALPQDNWTERYGLRDEEMRSNGVLVSDLFEPFFAEAARVLVPKTGVVLAKIADGIHSHKYQWNHVTLMECAELHGFTPCDLIIKVSWSRGGLVDPKWRRINHCRGVHTYWLAFRNGPDCVSRTAPSVAIKPRTGELFAEIVA